MFTENPAAYLVDFGVSVTWYGAPWAFDQTGPSLDSSKFGKNGLQQQTALALYEQPDQTILSQRVITRGYKIMFPSTQFVGMKFKDAVVKDGVNFQVVDVMSLDDGVWFEAELETIPAAPT